MKPEVPPNSLGKIARALLFAAHKHRDQRRKDAGATPYINHPIELLDLLVNVGGVLDPDILCAAILHDTLEDTETTAEELREAFGAPVTAVVLEVTDDTSLPKEERKRLQVEGAPSLSHGARLVKLADKTCNLRDVAVRPPPHWSAKRRREYCEWAMRVIGSIRGTNSSLEAAFDEAYTRCRNGIAE